MIIFKPTTKEEVDKIQVCAGEISLLADDIIEIIIAANYETTISDVDEINEHVLALTKNNPYYVLTITQQGSSSSKETKEYAAQESYRKNVIAQL